MSNAVFRRLIKKLAELENKETALKAKLDAIAQEQASYLTAREVYEREMGRPNGSAR